MTFDFHPEELLGLAFLLYSYLLRTIIINNYYQRPLRIFSPSRDRTLQYVPSVRCGLRSSLPGNSLSYIELFLFSCAIDLIHALPIQIFCVARIISFLNTIFLLHILQNEGKFLLPKTHCEEKSFFPEKPCSSSIF